MQLRPYQSTFSSEIDTHWQMGARNVLGVLPTGAGKTRVFSSKLAAYKGASVAIAHRQELVGQISLSLAGFGLRHRIIGPRNVIKLILEMQGDEYGTTFYDPNSPVAVAGVNTLLRRKDDLATWARQVGLWVNDESHHLLRENQWGKAVEMFPNACGLGVTATPERADGKGLGAHAEGVFHSIVEGPSMRELIGMGFLADYRVFAPPSDLDVSKVTVAKDGDYNKNELREAVHHSHIVGDVVGHYIKIANGKLGVTFATDVETATEIASQYNAAGVRAEVVSAKTPDKIRNELIKRFRKGEIKQLVNVDLFGEGFDLPAIEVVSMARPTQSYALHCQQFGRALRPMEAKQSGLIIDHVGNTMRHGLPDAVRGWTLDAKSRQSRASRDPNVVPVTTCTACFRVYESVRRDCPFCGYVAIPASRSKPEYVDGDLFELTPEALDALRNQVNVATRTPEQLVTDFRAQGFSDKIIGVNAARQRQKLTALDELREAIAWWAGYQRALKRSDSESYRRFYHKFGIDVLTAQTLKRTEMIDLTQRIAVCLPHTLKETQ